MSNKTFKAKVRLAWKARKDRDDPERPEEFTREELAKDEVTAVYRAVQWKLLCLLGKDHVTGEIVSWNEPFPLKDWDCVSFPLKGEIIKYCGKQLNRLPPEKDLSKFCAERRLWFGIEVEFPDPLSKHAEAYAPDGSVMFKEDYDGEPPSFYAAVEEYYPVYELKRVARGDD